MTEFMLNFPDVELLPKSRKVSAVVEVVKMRREVKRYVIRSRWCGWAIGIFLVWSLCLAYAMLYDSRAYVIVYPLTVILFVLLSETVYIVVYENAEGS